MKDKWLPKHIDKSRNALGMKSATTIVLNKPVKSITPIKACNVQRGGRNEVTSTPREKALMKQNADLKKENAELIRLLKKSKELLKDDVSKSRSENLAMKRFIEAAWSLVDGKIEEKLRDEVKPIIGIKDSSGKMNTITTNHTDNISAELQTERGLKDKLLKIDPEELELLRRNLLEKDVQNKVQVLELNEIKRENENIVNYLVFSQNKKQLLPQHNYEESKEILPVDSANVGSEADEDEISFETCSIKRHNNTTTTLPGFIKTLTLKAVP